MDESEIQRAVERIYDDESLTEELDDEAAEWLLKWGEDQVFRLAEQHTDEAAFFDAADHIRKAMRQINRLVGLGDGLDPDQQKSALDEMVASARALGTDITDQQIMSYLQHQADMPAEDQLKRLAELVRPPNDENSQTEDDDFNV